MLAFFFQKGYEAFAMRGHSAFEQILAPMVQVTATLPSILHSFVIYFANKLKGSDICIRSAFGPGTMVRAFGQ